MVSPNIIFIGHLFYFGLMLLALFFILKIFLGEPHIHFWLGKIKNNYTFLIPFIASMLAYLFIIFQMDEIVSYLTWICLTSSMLISFNLFYKNLELTKTDFKFLTSIFFSCLIALSINFPIVPLIPGISPSLMRLTFLSQQLTWLFLSNIGYLLSSLQAENLPLKQRSSLWKEVRKIVLRFKLYPTKLDLLIWFSFIVLTIPRIVWGLVPGSVNTSGIWAFSEDEWIEIFKVITMIENGTLFVNHYAYPSLHRYFLWYIFVPLFPLKDFIGIDNFYWIALLIARITSLAFGILLLFFVRKVISHFFNNTLGYVTSFSLVVMPVYVLFAADAKPDMMMTFLVFCCLFLSFFSIIRLNKGSLRLSWIFLALATTTKYNAFFGILIPGVATIIFLFHDLKINKSSISHASLYSILSPYGSYIIESIFFGLIGTPDLLRQFPAFWTQFSAELHHQATGHLGVPSGSLMYWFNYAPTEFGADLFIFSWFTFLVGIVITIFYISKKKNLETKYLLFGPFLLLFIIPYWFILSLTKVGFLAYLMPISPFLSVSFGFWSFLKKIPFKLIFKIVLLLQIVILVSMFPQTLASQNIYENDTRYQIAPDLYNETNLTRFVNPTIVISPYVWISSNIASSSNVLLINDGLAGSILNGTSAPQLIILSSAIYTREIALSSNSNLVSFYKDLVQGSLLNYSLVHKIIPTGNKTANDYEKPVVFSLNITTILNSFNQSLNIFSSWRNSYGPTILIFQSNH